MEVWVEEIFSCFTFSALKHWVSTFNSDAFGSNRDRCSRNSWLGFLFCVLFCALRTLCFAWFAVKWYQLLVLFGTFLLNWNISMQSTSPTALTIIRVLREKFQSNVRFVCQLCLKLIHGPVGFCSLVAFEMQFGTFLDIMKKLFWYLW